MSMTMRTAYFKYFETWTVAKKEYNYFNVTEILNISSYNYSLYHLYKTSKVCVAQEQPTNIALFSLSPIPINETLYAYNPHFCCHYTLRLGRITEDNTELQELRKKCNHKHLVEYGYYYLVPNLVFSTPIVLYNQN